MPSGHQRRSERRARDALFGNATNTPSPVRQEQNLQASDSKLLDIQADKMRHNRTELQKVREMLAFLSDKLPQSKRLKDRKHCPSFPLSPKMWGQLTAKIEATISFSLEGKTTQELIERVFKQLECMQNRFEFALSQSERWYGELQSEDRTMARFITRMNEGCEKEFADELFQEIAGPHEGRYILFNVYVDSMVRTRKSDRMANCTRLYICPKGIVNIAFVCDQRFQRGPLNIFRYLRGYIKYASLHPLPEGRVEDILKMAEEEHKKSQ